jgi:3-dehydroquinate synthase
VVLPEYLHFSSQPDQILSELVGSLRPDKVAILVDEHTREHCLPLLSTIFELIEIKSGEQNKTLETCGHIWSRLTEMGFSRKSLLVNLGGGVIGDMGGFAASTYKRGIRFINFPTTLLSMVDASIGGKLGVDFNGFKNHIGVFNEPTAVVVCAEFLKTLPDRQITSGFAEVLKHGLIANRKYWNDVKKAKLESTNWETIIPLSIEIKQQVVSEDPLEAGRRKILNFGHTLGHAIETHYLGTDEELLHGEAIAIGMILEAHLSHQKLGLSLEEVNAIVKTLRGFFDLRKLPELSEWEQLMTQDKKNEGGKLNFALLKAIGVCHYDIEVASVEVQQALDYYHQIR